MSKIKLNCSIAFQDNTKNLINYLKLNNLFDIIKNHKGVYLIHNISENKYYVGSTTNSYYDRIFNLRYGSHRAFVHCNKHGYINKLNLTNFEIIIMPNTDVNCRYIEERYIKLLKTYLPQYGYNKTPEGGLKLGIYNTTPVTNGKIIKYINEDEDLPKGFYPGRLKSILKIFCDSFDSNLLERNSKSDYKVIYSSKSYLNSLGISQRSHRGIDRLQNELLKYLNIKLILE